MERYYPLRRIPESVSMRVLWSHLRGAAKPLGRSIAASVRASLPLPRDPDTRQALKEEARETGNLVFEELQHIYFDNPGLDTLTVRQLTKLGRDVAHLGAFVLRAQKALRINPERAQENLRNLPRSGYDSLMVTGLAAGKSLGLFRGGRISTKLWWDSANPQDDVKFEPGHRRPRVRRFDPPRSLGDMAADIDDLYWADAYGQSIKVTRVGTGSSRRWLASLPGTDHSDFETQPNPADIEANLREELNMPNAMRRGTIEAIRLAMRSDGVAAEQIPSEPVLICGHSQGGMVAVALASTSPANAGIKVDRVLTLGSPTRRMRLREDVVAVAVEHDQDIVPSLDATPRFDRDQRVTVQRKLNPPRSNPLFYAHSSSTYTETVRRLERRNAVAPWGRESRAIRALQDYLPREGEETRVFHLYVWQQVREAADRHPWTDLLEGELPVDWEPVHYDGEIAVDSGSGRSVTERLALLTEQFRPRGGEASAGGDETGSEENHSERTPPEDIGPEAGEQPSSAADSVPENVETESASRAGEGALSGDSAREMAPLSATEDGTVVGVGGGPDESHVSKGEGDGRA